jgi:hypothetical protein
VRPPRLVKVTYRPSDPFVFDGRIPALALVGKGITFDSGGLSLKSPTGMETMKTDMGGAAAVLASLDAIAALGGRTPVTAWTPMTENMPSGSATKPGDVLTTRSGKTIEVLNTDAEGRLVLADGLTLATEQAPDAVIDLATLTGAAVVALGKEIAGLLGNDDELRDAVQHRREPLVQHHGGKRIRRAHPGDAGHLRDLRPLVGRPTEGLTGGSSPSAVRRRWETTTGLHYRLPGEDRSPRGRVLGYDGGLAGRPQPRHSAVGPEPRRGRVRQRGP